MIKLLNWQMKNVDFYVSPQQLTLSMDEEKAPQIYEPELLVGDARDLSFLQDNSVDLICAHPPYAINTSLYRW
jgi:ubiquinone/menaquinone biosynthesis C-methylase UbiE